MTPPEPSPSELPRWVALSDKVIEGVATNLASAAVLFLLAQVAGLINEPPPVLNIIAIFAAVAAVSLFVVNVDFHRRSARDAVADPGPWEPTLSQHLPEEQRIRAHDDWLLRQGAHARHAERQRSFRTILRVTALLLAFVLLGGLIAAYAAGLI